MKAHSDWIEDRRQSIGGSDAAAIRGISNWTTPLQVAHSKRGLIDPRPERSDDRFEIGLLLEFAVADLTRRRIGDEYEVIEDPDDMAEALDDEALDWTVYRFAPEGSRFESSQIIVRRKGYRHVHATPDAIIRHRETGQLWVAEWKTSSEFMASEWRDGVPDYYRVQARHNAAVLGLEGCTCAVMLGYSTFHLSFEPGEADPDAYLAEVTGWYERHVLGDDEPVALALDDKSPSYLGAINADRDDQIISLPIETVDLDDRYAEVIAALKPLEAEKDGIRARMKQLVGAHSGGVVPNGTTWKYRGRGLVRIEDSTD